MSLPAPRVGWVIRYNFPWSHEKAAGKDEATKDRPAAIVVATRQESGEVRVIVAPITHEPPVNRQDSIEISASVRGALGLDDHPQWLRWDELNRFTWPGYDLRPIPGSPRR
ncbi:MAG TPA: growth inhibitor PemK [Acetobacteraceae bacterium]|nr:growth inhibitor PemK [Acetobacteraceae bacterium]